MPLREDLLAPIAGDNPAGQDLYYDKVFDQIKDSPQRSAKRTIFPRGATGGRSQVKKAPTIAQSSSWQAKHSPRAPRISVSQAGSSKRSSGQRVSRSSLPASI